MNDQYIQWIGVSLALIGWLGVRQIQDLQMVSIGLSLWILSAMLITIWGIRTGARAIALQNAVNLCFAVSALYPLIVGGAL